MKNNRIQTLSSLAKGLFAAVALTLLLMAAVAALAVRLRLEDGTLTVLNS